MASFMWWKDYSGSEDGLKEVATEPGTPVTKIVLWSTEKRAGEHLEDAKEQTDKGRSGERLGKELAVEESGGHKGGILDDSGFGLSGVRVYKRSRSVLDTLSGISRPRQPTGSFVNKSRTREKRAGVGVFSTWEL